MLQNDIICHANAFCAKCNTDSGYYYNKLQLEITIYIHYFLRQFLLDSNKY